MTVNYDEKKSIERTQRAFELRMNSFIRMQNNLHSKIDNDINDAVIDEFHAADAEFKAAMKEMDEIAAEIQNGIRK